MIYKHTIKRPKLKSTKEPSLLLQDIGYYICCRTQIPPKSIIGDLAFFWFLGL